ncbi:MAG: DNA-3-methyladenine glycosylase family protein [Actinomycetales bacterium]
MATRTEPLRRDYAPGHPLTLRAVLVGLRHGAGDRCCRWEPDGRCWWATGTPDGPALLSLAVAPGDRTVQAQAWGAGAEWVLDGVPELLGARDNPEEFRPIAEHGVLRTAHAAHPGLRVMRTRRVFDSFAAACLEQRVTGKEAFYAWRRLVTRFGEPAPGPAGDPHSPAAGMWIPPTPEQWRAIPSWEWLQAGVDQTRRSALLGGARASQGLERTLEVSFESADQRLRTLPGVGRWTSAEVRQRAHGDPDAFSFGDYHVAKNVSYALTGQVLDDDGCAELIECYRGHRLRVQRLIELAGIARPRRGPRMRLPSHTPTRQAVYRPSR